ncbi:TPA: single-stranded DNA-binding protein, partial [Clostridioides difficile]|nr:single-stranded DNA-binding protein [Clostridioides difficile]
MNTITLVGRLVADAELKYLPNSGTPKITFSMAVDRRFKDKNGCWKSITKVNVNALELLSSKSDSNNHKEQQEYIPPGL